MLAAAVTRQYRALEALGRAAGHDAAREVARELGRLRARIDAYQAAHRELSDELALELEGIERRLSTVEARLAELDTRFDARPQAARTTVPVERH